MATLIQKGDLNTNDFTNDNTNAQQGVGVSRGPGSSVRIAIDERNPILGTTAPSAPPTTGQVWYVDRSTSPWNVYYWDGTTWNLTGDGSGGGGGINGIAVQDEGTALAGDATGLNFVGAGVTAAGTGATKTVTVPGGVAVQDEGVALATQGQTLNFVGAGVTAAGTGATKTIAIPGTTVRQNPDYDPIDPDTLDPMHYRADPNNGTPPVNWYGMTFETTPDGLILNFKDVDGNPVSALVAGGEDLIILNNPVFLVRPGGSANPPIETQADLATMPFSSFNAVRSFMTRALIVGTVTVDARGTYQVGDIGPAQFKNAQNIVVRGDPADPSAFVANATGAAMIVTGGTVTFQDATVNFPASGGAPNKININGSGTLRLRGRVRFTGDFVHSSGRSNIIRVTDGSLSLSDVELIFAMSAGHRVTSFVTNDSSMTLSGGVIFNFENDFNAQEIFGKLSASRTNAYMTGTTPPVFTGAGQLLGNYVWAMANLTTLYYNGWTPLVGGWPQTPAVVNNFADYCAVNGTMGLDL